MHFDAIFNRQKTWTVTRSLGTRNLRFKFNRRQSRNEIYKNNVKVIQKFTGGGAMAPSAIAPTPWIRHWVKKLENTLTVCYTMMSATNMCTKRRIDRQTEWPAEWPQWPHHITDIRRLRVMRGAVKYQVNLLMQAFLSEDRMRLPVQL